MTDELFSKKLVDYLDSLVPERAEELARMEAFGKRTGFPIIGPASGHFCYLAARLIGRGRCSRWARATATRPPGSPGR